MTFDPSDCAHMSIRRASRLIGQFYDARMKPADVLPTQYSLMVLLNRLEAAPISQLAEAVGMDRTTLTRNLKLLERDGLVRQDIGEDARTRFYSLSSEGHLALKDTFTHWQSTYADFVARFGEERWQNLRSELRALQAALQDE